MSTPLTGLDAAFLYLETPTNHMHVGTVFVIDPTTAAGGAISWDQILEYWERRLHLAPLFRRRLVEVPLRLDHPRWIEDPDFELEYHVRRAALPSPGGMTELGIFAGDVMSRPLDRSRPLWEAWIVEGLEDGRMAIVSKAHHAAVDGMSGMQVNAAFLSLSPDAEPPPPKRRWRPEPVPSDVRMLGTAMVRNALMPWRALRVGVRASRDLLGPLLPRLNPFVEVAAQEGATPGPLQAPMTPLNGSISAWRRITFAQMPLDRVKHTKNVLGGTVNDVVLAAVTGSLRRYLLEEAGRADRPLVGMVPISVRSDADDPTSGNRVSMMLVELPVDEEDPEAAYDRLRRSSTEAKQRHDAISAGMLQDLAEVTPGGVFSLAARLYSRSQTADRHRPLWNTVVSNVPGPRVPLYALGARVEAMYPMGPIHEGVGVNITLFSYGDQIFVGINSDRELIRQPQAIADGIVDAAEQLAKRADERP